MNQSRIGLVRRIGQALRRVYEQRGAAKAIARAAEFDSRTVEAWLYGAAAPRSPELVLLMADNPCFEAEIVALVRELREIGLTELSRQPPGAAEAAGQRDSAPGGVVPSSGAPPIKLDVAPGGVPHFGNDH